MVTTALAQKQVTGTVTDDSGEPIIGANILVKGTDVGTVTEFDGTYSISVNEGDILVFSYTGYDSQEITVGGDSKYDLMMVEGILMEDIVVTGVAQGISEKKIGFAIAKIDSEQLEKVPAVDAGNALRGKTSGVRVVQASGNPAVGTEIRLRGSTNISGSQRPLILIDGVITDGDLSSINMEDVESMEVLKGAAASSLYGSLAGNGVIQIITKRGAKEEKTTYSLRTEIGFSSLARDYPVSTKHNHLLDENGEFALGADGKIQTDPDGLYDNDYPVYHENEKNLFSRQPWRTFSAQVANTGKKVNYFLGYQNLRQEGLIEGLQPYKRNSIRGNVDLAATDKFFIKTSVAIVRGRGSDESEQGQGGNLFYSALTSSPIVDWTEKDSTGGFAVNPANTEILPGANQQSPFYQATLKQDTYKQDKLTAGIDLRYDATNWLRLSAGYSIDQSNYEGRLYYPTGYTTPTPNSQLQNGYLSHYDEVNRVQVYQGSAFFHHKFDKLGTGLTLKYLYEDRDLDFQRATTFDLAANVQVLQAGQQENASIRSGSFPEKAENIFAYLDLDWDDKIIFNGLVRRDGSSLFGVDARYRYYWRTSLAYILTEDLNVKHLDFAKIRMSYGTSGLRPFAWGAQYDSYFITPDGPVATNVGNPDIQPSVVKEFEVGFNATVFKKVNVEFNFADSRTTDDVLEVPTPAIGGFSSQFRNAGSLDSRAYELSIGAEVLNKKGFTWDVNLNFDKVTQNIGAIDVAPYTRNTDTALPLFRVEEGLPYGTIFGNKFVSSADEFVLNDEGYIINEGVPVANSIPADYISNEDGYLVYAPYYNTENERPLLVSNEDGTKRALAIGNTNPDFNIGFASTMSYKGLTLYALLDWQNGGDIYNYTKQNMYFNERHRDLQEYSAIGKHGLYAVQGLYNGADAVSHFVEDGSFLKLRELSLAYSLPSKALDFANGKISDVTIAITGRNLFTATRYSGWDPEVAIRNNPTNFRMDEYSYPNFRTFTFGLGVKF